MLQLQGTLHCKLLMWGRHAYTAPSKAASEKTGRIREAKILGTWTLQFTQLFLRMLQV